MSSVVTAHIVLVKGNAFNVNIGTIAVKKPLLRAVKFARGPKVPADNHFQL